MTAWFERQDEYGDYGLSQDNILDKPSLSQSKETEMTPEKSNTLPFTSRRKKFENQRGQQFDRGRQGRGRQDRGRQNDRYNVPDRMRSRDSSLSSVHSARSVQSVNSVQSAYSAGGGRRRRRKRKSSSGSVRSGSMDNIQVTCGQSNRREVKLDSKYNYQRRSSEQLDNEYGPNNRNYRRSQERLDTYVGHKRQNEGRSDNRFEGGRGGRGRGRGRERLENRNEERFGNRNERSFGNEPERMERNIERSDRNTQNYERGDRNENRQANYSDRFDRNKYDRDRENRNEQDRDRNRDTKGRDNFNKEKMGRGRGRIDRDSHDKDKPGPRYDDRRDKQQQRRSETRTRSDSHQSYDDNRETWKQGDRRKDSSGSNKDNQRSRTSSGSSDKVAGDRAPPQKHGGLIHLPPPQAETPEPPVSPGPRHDYHHEAHRGRDAPRGRGMGRARHDSGGGRKTLFDPKNPNTPIVISEGKPQLEFKDTDEHPSSPQSPHQYPMIPPGRGPGPGPGMYGYGQYGPPGYGYGYPMPPFPHHKEWGTQGWALQEWDPQGWG